MADKLQYLYDDFNSGFDAAKWWRSDPVACTVTGGQFQTTPTNGYHYTSTVDDWDLIGSYVSFELVQNANEGLGSIGTTITYGDWEDDLEFEIDGGASGVAKVKCHERFQGSSDTTEFTYNSTDHRWFRIVATEGGIVQWQTSPDGATWTTRRTSETGVPLTERSVRISSYFWDAETDPGTTILDNFNLHAGIPGRPKAETLVDDFAFQDDNKWIWEDWSCPIVENTIVDKQLHMLSSETNYSPLYAKGTYDLTDSHFGLQLVQTNPEGNGTFLNDISVGPDLDNCVYIRFGSWDSWISFTQKVDGVASSGGPIQLNGARHRWFRIREDSGTVYFDTSIDGAYWTERWSTPTVVDLTNSYIRLYCAPYDTEDPATIIWDNVNNFSGNTIGPEIPFKSEQFTDTFDVDDGSWYQADGIQFIDGTLQCSPTDEYQWQTCTDVWDLTESYAMWEMVQNALAGTSGWDGKGTTSTELIVTPQTEPLENTSLRFAIFGGPTGIVKCQLRVDGVNDDVEFTYDPQSCRYFRFRDKDGIVYWETSPNSITWTIRRSSPAVGVDRTHVKFGLSIGYWDSENEFGPNGTVILDNFNIPDYTLKNAIAWGRSDLALGGRKTGTVQPRTFFEEAAWLWDPIPEDPVLDPLSEEIANSALHDPTRTPPPDHGTSFIAYGNTLVHPHMIKPDTPRYFMYMDWVDKFNEWNDPPDDPEELYEHPFPQYGTTEPGIPIPYGIQLPPGSDCHLTVADPVTGKVFSFWQARYDPVLDIWRCTYGGYADLHGDGRELAGSATATNISRYACQATIAELQAGEIPHALFVVSNACAMGRYTEPDEDGNWWDFDNGIRYPAQKSDGLNPTNVEYPVPQGARLQLDPSIDLSTYGLSPAEYAVGRCWQKYGAYVLDSGGGTAKGPSVGGASISELWQGQEYPLFPFLPHTEPWTEDFDMWDGYPDLDDIPTPPVYEQLGLPWDYYAFRKIPWAGNIRVLKNWNGKDEITDPRLYAPDHPDYLGPGATP